MLSSRRRCASPALSALLWGLLCVVLCGPASSAALALPWQGLLKFQKISDSQGSFNGILANSDVFGISVADLGDIDGDSRTDIAVGASLTDDGGTDKGAVHILRLNANGTVKSSQKIASGIGGFAPFYLDNNDQFGRAVAPLGDLDGDQVRDLAVGAYYDDDGGPDRGAVWILFLFPNGTVKSVTKISDLFGDFLATLVNYELFGVSLAGLGDLNGDQVNDLAVGSYDGSVGTGAVWILFLRTNGTVNSFQKITTLSGNFTAPLQASDLFGITLASMGDLNGDLIGDLLVGAAGDNSNRGAVYLLYLNKNGTVKFHRKISSVDGGFTGVLDAGDAFSRGIASLGDIDGDAVGDILVGASSDDDVASNAGAAWVLFLNASGMVKSHRKISASLVGFLGQLGQDDEFGRSAARLGDLNGDSIPDFVVGAPYGNDNGPDRGAVYVLFGNSSGLSTTSSAVSTSSSSTTSSSVLSSTPSITSVSSSTTFTSLVTSSTTSSVSTLSSVASSSFATSTSTASSATTGSLSTGSIGSTGSSVDSGGSVTPELSASATPSSGSSEGLIVGVVVGVAVCCCLVICLAFLFVRRKRQDEATEVSRSSTSAHGESTETGSYHNMSLVSMADDSGAYHNVNVKLRDRFDDSDEPFQPPTDTPPIYAQADRSLMLGTSELAAPPSNTPPVYGQIYCKYAPETISSAQSRSGDYGFLPAVPQAAMVIPELDPKKLVTEVEIGSGNFGVVYSGRYDSQRVAIKVLKNERGADALADFLAEAAMMARAGHHPNVLDFVGVTLAANSNSPTLVTKFCSGSSLEKLIESRELRERESRKITAGIAAGMAHLASARIVHRDLASRNVLLEADLNPLIADLGMARFLESDNTAQRTQVTMGPLRWFAPECVFDNTYSEKSDVWAFGCTIIEMLTRTHPYPDLGAIDAATMVMKHELRPDVPSNCPSKIAPVLPLCFEWEPEDRPSFEKLCTLLK